MLSPAAKLALRNAQRSAAEAGSSYIGPEHVLLGLAANSDSPAAQALAGARLPQAEGQKVPSDTPTLDEYGRDLTAEARAGKVDPVVGRAEEIEQTVEILSRRRKNNPVLIGDPGVGKTAIVEGWRSASSTATFPRPSPTAGSSRWTWDRWWRAASIAANSRSG